MARFTVWICSDLLARSGVMDLFTNVGSLGDSGSFAVLGSLRSYGSDRLSLARLLIMDLLGLEARLGVMDLSKRVATA